tara:strand:+ start:1492 stop:2652 length:1161 start_codon:yes stop_codon:yes gene_type:complete
MPYFVGNVLPSSSAPGENDTTFDFTNDESRTMSLRDVPIRIEHQEGLAVGSVQRDWTDKDGKKWILGKVDETSLEGRYAAHAIQPSSIGHTLYTGLSLQHVHTSFRDGSTRKRPIEVSLCTEPRRPGCQVVSVDKSKKKEYITHLASRQNMSEASIVSETPVETTTSESPAEPSSQPQTVDNREELMNLVINQESELGDTKAALEKAQEELNKLQSAWKQREENETLETKSKAEALSKALVESWSASLPADAMTDENKKAIFAMAQNFPKESVKMLEIAHKASKKYKSDMDSMAVQQQVKQKRELESRVMDIVTKKRRITTLPETKSVVHAASTRVANPFSFDTKLTSSSMNSVRDRNPDLFNALSGFSSGNLRDRMGQIAKINGN